MKQDPIHLFPVGVTRSGRTKSKDGDAVKRFAYRTIESDDGRWRLVKVDFEASRKSPTVNGVVESVGESEGYASEAAAEKALWAILRPEPAKFVEDGED